jgi:hypothetical protein
MAEGLRDAWQRRLEADGDAVREQLRREAAQVQAGWRRAIAGTLAAAGPAAVAALPGLLPSDN